MKKQLKKLLVILLCGLVGLPMIPVSAQENTENEEFNAFLEEEFRESMESDYTSMHQLLADYHSLGFEPVAIDFGQATLESYQEAIEMNNEALEKLHSFDYDSLSEEQQYTYRCYEDAIYYSNELNKYPMFDWYLSLSTGIVEDLITIMNEFVFYKATDFDDYIVLLKSMPEFLNQAIDLTKTQASEGYFMDEVTLDETLDWIDTFTARTEDNVLITIFEKAVDDFEGLTPEQRTQYKAENRQIVLNEVIPTYQTVATVLEELRGSSKYEGGLYHYPDGEAYYTALAQNKTSTKLSVDEMIEIMEEFISEAFDVYYMAIISDQDIYDKVDALELPFDDPEGAIAFLDANRNRYPETPPITYQISYLDPSVANPNTVAYFVYPPMDIEGTNTIRVNGDNISDSQTLYETIAHEGIPGHMYQRFYFSNTNPSWMRQLLTFIGYGEGWAMYVEDQSWRDIEGDEVAKTYRAVETQLNYAISAYSDLGVNGKGWSEEELGQHFEALGINSQIASAFYGGSLERPGLILPYGFGLAYFHRLRGKALAAFGEDFNEVEFHRVLLNHGQRRFEIVEEDLDRYILENGKEIPTDFEYLKEKLDTVVGGGELPDGTYDEDPSMGYFGYVANRLVPRPVGYVLAGLLVILCIVAIIRLVKNSKGNPLG